MHFEEIIALQKRKNTKMDDKKAKEILEDYIDNITHVGPVSEAIRFMLEQEPKADMVAMLTEIQLEIEEREQYYKDKFLEPSNAVHESAMSGRMFGCGDCKELIQQKIDKLKEVNHDKRRDRKYT